MPIISVIGRRSWKTRALIACIYAALLSGSVTMVYPFCLMLAGTTRTGADGPVTALLPRYLHDDVALYRKTLEALFNESPGDYRVAYNRPTAGFAFVDPPGAGDERFVDHWRDFLEEKRFPFYYFTVGHSQIQASRGTFPWHLRAFKRERYGHYDGDLARMNRESGTEFDAWSGFRVQESAHIYRRAMPDTRLEFLRAWYRFKETTPLSSRVYPTATGYYKYNVLMTQYSDRIDNYNRTHGTGHATYDAIALTRRAPENVPDAERHDWEFFVRNLLNLLWVEVDASATPAYRDFLRARHGGDVAALNRAHGTAYATFEEAALVERVPFDGAVFADWGSFIRGWTDPSDGRVHRAPLASLSINTVEFLFQDWLRARYGSVDAANAACGTSFADFSAIHPPQDRFHRREILRGKSHWRREFTVRNYIAVADYVLLHGRAMSNTAIYCTLAVLCALIVNPLAAYALSRFRPPSTYKILLFLMLTMSFPPMVTQIPNFLLLREAGLLNTFAALLLPGLANGYQIFLLKGFFDSLPREIYESAQIDGAGEVRMFWQFTMSLSKPILAVIALQAFTGAYGNFMMALLICQDPAMWTLMPWLYQLQMNSCQSVVFTSLLIASIPTFIIFVFAQNVIMRGIVVPVEK